MTQEQLQREIQISGQGRVVIPAALRRALGIEPGDVLVARIDEGRLIIEKTDVIRQRLRSRFANASGRSLSRELIEERRAEARKENQ